MASVKIISKRSNIKKILARLPKGIVVAGLPVTSGSYDSGETVVSVGTAHEFGVSERQTFEGHNGEVTVSAIPERSFIRSTATENRKKWVKDVADSLPFILDGTMKPNTLLGAIGSIMERDIKQKIIDIQAPPNSPQVIADKGSNNPLIDTGRLVRSITHELRED